MRQCNIDRSSLSLPLATPARIHWIPIHVKRDADVRRRRFWDTRVQLDDTRARTLTDWLFFQNGCTEVTWRDKYTKRETYPHKWETYARLIYNGERYLQWQGHRGKWRREGGGMWIKVIECNKKKEVKGKGKHYWSVHNWTRDKVRALLATLPNAIWCFLLKSAANWLTE